LQAKVVTLQREKEELLAASKKALQEIEEFLNALHAMDVNNNLISGGRQRHPIEKELRRVVHNSAKENQE